jgi:hypothetical protein
LWCSASFRSRDLSRALVIVSRELTSFTAARSLPSVVAAARSGRVSCVPAAPVRWSALRSTAMLIRGGVWKWIGSADRRLARRSGNTTVVAVISGLDAERLLGAGNDRHRRSPCSFHGAPSARRAAPNTTCGDFSDASRFPWAHPVSHGCDVGNSAGVAYGKING